MDLKTSRKQKEENIKKNKKKKKQLYEQTMNFIHKRENKFKKNLQIKLAEFEEIKKKKIEELDACSYCKKKTWEFADSDGFDNHLLNDCPILFL